MKEEIKELLLGILDEILKETYKEGYLAGEYDAKEEIFGQGKDTLCNQ